MQRNALNITYNKLPLAQDFQWSTLWSDLEGLVGQQDPSFPAGKHLQHLQTNNHKHRLMLLKTGQTALKCYAKKISQQILCVISSPQWLSHITFRPRGPVLPPGPSLPCGKQKKLNKFAHCLVNITASQTLMRTLLLFHIFFPINYSGSHNSQHSYQCENRVCHALILTSIILLPPI